MKSHESPSPKKQSRESGMEGNCQWQVTQNVKKESIVFRNEEIFDDVKPLYKDSEHQLLYKLLSMLRSNDSWVIRECK